MDVREPFEWEICRIAGRAAPAAELPARVAEIAADAGVVTVCHTGVRSLTAARFLREAGIPPRAEPAARRRGGVGAPCGAHDGALLTADG